MECVETRENLTAFLLGDLSEGESAAVRGHLDSCAGCKAEALLLRKTLDALSGMKEIGASAARKADLMAAAGREGFAARRGRGFKAAIAAFSLAAAAAAALLISAPFIWSGPGKTPDPSEQPVAPDQEESAKPVASFVSGQGAVVYREGKSVASFPESHQPLFRGDRIAVEGPRSHARIRFHEDALDLTLWGYETAHDGAMDEIPGGTEVRLEGVNETAYRVRVDRGLVTGSFPMPIETQPSRRRDADFTPLVILSPVGQAEMRRGREFRVRQDKVALWNNYFEVKPGGGAQVAAYSMRFEGFDLGTFVSRHLAQAMPGKISFGAGVLDGRKITLICNTVPADQFPSLLDRALAPEGLEFREDLGGFVIARREGGAQPAAPPWKNPAYGEFQVETNSPDAYIKISSCDPNRPGAIFVTGGKSGVVRPGLDPSSPLRGASVEVKRIDGIELVGTLVGRDDRVAVVSAAGSGKKSTLRPGDGIAGFTVEWVAWDHVVLSKSGAEYRLRKQ